MLNPSQTDIEHLKIIRASVRDFICSASESFDSPENVVLDVAPQDHEGAREFFKKARIETLDIDPSSGATYVADLCEDNSRKIPSDRFDAVICTEVLEHVLNPFNAVDEIWRMLKQGGVCFVSTPFNLRIHGPLPDCWRFTDHGLRSLFHRFSNVRTIPTEDPERPLMPIHYKTIAKK